MSEVDFNVCPVCGTIAEVDDCESHNGDWHYDCPGCRIWYKKSAYYVLRDIAEQLPDDLDWVTFSVDEGGDKIVRLSGEWNKASVACETWIYSDIQYYLMLKGKVAIDAFRRWGESEIDGRFSLESIVTERVFDLSDLRIVKEAIAFRDGNDSQGQVICVDRKEWEAMQPLATAVNEMHTYLLKEAGYGEN